MSTPTLAPLGDKLRPIAETMIPAVINMNRDDYQRFLQTVDAQLAMQPDALRRQIKVFVHVLGALARLRHGKPWTKLTVNQREALLRRVQDAPITKLRIGTWGLRTLLYLGHYSNPETQQALGYTPNVNGWSAYQGAHRG